MSASDTSTSSAEGMGAVVHRFGSTRWLSARPFRGAEVENRTFAVGHKDQHFLYPQQQVIAAEIWARLNRMLAAGDITARQLAMRAAGNPLDS